MFTQTFNFKYIFGGGKESKNQFSGHSIERFESKLTLRPLNTAHVHTCTVNSTRQSSARLLRRNHSESELQFVTLQPLQANARTDHNCCLPQPYALMFVILSNPIQQC
jgi:hypothetical protein